MRVAIIAALLGALGLAQPAQALDKVTFGTNWLADPEAGGYYQALVDGTYAEIRARRHHPPGRPALERRHAAGRRQDRVLHGRRHDRRLPVGEHNIPTIAVAADFQKNPQVFMSHPGVGLDKWDDLPNATRPSSAPARSTLLGLDAARLRLQGRERQALQFQFGPVHRRQEFDPAGLHHLRAVRGRAAGPLQAQHLPARGLRLHDLFDP